MKQLFTLLFALSIFSCTKDSNGYDTTTKYCWACKTYVTTTIQGQSSSATSSRDYCDKSESEIKQIEKDGTGTITTTSSGVTVVTKTTTNCTN